MRSREFRAVGRGLLLASSAHVALAAVLGSGAFAQSFQGLPFQSAYGVSANGLVIAGNDTTALRWTAADGVRHLGASSAEGISADGLVIVGSGKDAFDGMKWTAATGAVPL